MNVFATSFPERRILSESVCPYDPLWQEVEPGIQVIFMMRYALTWTRLLLIIFGMAVTWLRRRASMRSKEL